MAISSPLGALHARSVGLNARYGLGPKPPAPPPRPPAGGHPAAGDAITAQIRALLGPLEQQLTDQYNRTVHAGGGAISGYASELAKQLGQYAPAAANIYGGAEQSQAASDAALSGALSGGGQDLAAQLSAKLGQINAPGNTPQQVAETGQHAGNALLGTGTASLDRLIAEGASAANYGAKLPGIARQQGLSDIRDLTLASNKTLADQMGQVRGQIPGLVQNIEGSQAKAAADDRKTQVALLIAQGRYKEAEQVATMNNQTKRDIANQNAQLKASSQDIAQGRSDRSYRLQFAKTFGYDPVTGKVTPGFSINAKGDVVKTGAAGKQPHLTAFQRQKFMGTASTIASNGLSGFTDSKGTQHPPIGWQEALTEMDKEGIPRPLALAAIEKYYPVNIAPGGLQTPTRGDISKAIAAAGG